MTLIVASAIQTGSRKGRITLQWGEAVQITEKALVMAVEALQKSLSAEFDLTV